MVRAEAVREQFDADSRTYLARYSTPLIKKQNQRLVRLVGGRKKCDTVLDIGCGPGTMAQELLTVGEEVYGLDISPAMIAKARHEASRMEQGGRLHFQVGDAECLPFPDQYFDAVVCAGVLRYLSSWKKGVDEVSRVLKPNGVVVMTFYWKFSLQWFAMCFLYRPLLPLISLIKGRSVKECLLRYKAEPLPLSYRKVKGKCRAAGFADLQTQHAGFDVFPFNRIFERWATRLSWMLEDAWFDSNWLGWLGSICVVKAVRSPIGQLRADDRVALSR